MHSVYAIVGFLKINLKGPRLQPHEKPRTLLLESPAWAVVSEILTV
jgi:hypothetical protein